MMEMGILSRPAALPGRKALEMHDVISEIITFCVITLCVRKVITICVERLLHFALKILLHFASMLLHFALVLRFAAIQYSLGQ